MIAVKRLTWAGPNRFLQGLRLGLTVAAMTLAAGCDRTPEPVPGASVPPVAKGPTATETYELRERCAKDAREWFNQNYPPNDEPIRVQGGGSIANLPPTYQNHYSQTHNGCYAFVYEITNFSYGKKPTPRDMVVQTNAMYDVHDNTRMGVFVVKNMSEVTACEFTGTKCSSKEEFMGLAKSYFTD